MHCLACRGITRLFCAVLVTTCLFLESSVYGQVNTEAMRRLVVEPGWHNSLSLSAAYSSGNTDFLSLRTRVRSDYTHQQLHTFLVANLQQAEKDGKSFTSKGFVHMRGIYSAHPRAMVEAFVQKQFNESLLLDDRNLLGGGVRLALILPQGDEQKSGIRLYLGIGAMLENETLTQGDEPETTLVRSTNYLTGSWRLDERVMLSGTTYIQPALSELSDIRVLTDANLRFELTKRLSFSTRLNLRYDSEPPLELDGMDVELLQGVSYDF